MSDHYKHVPAQFNPKFWLAQGGKGDCGPNALDVQPGSGGRGEGVFGNGPGVRPKNFFRPPLATGRICDSLLLRDQQ